MLAFTALPAVGDMLGNPILLSSDATGPNELTVILDDTTNAALGFVTATITTSDGQTGQYYNFSGISYSASNDTDGSVRNSVKLWTSYEADLAGFETAPADDAAVGLSTTWVVDSHFGPGGAAVPMVMLNVDALTVTSGVIGGNSSTIAGEFESPTLPPDLNATTAASITLISGTGVTGANIDGTEAFEPIVAYTLSITSQTAGFQPGTDIFTVGDLTITTAQNVSINDLLQTEKGDISIASTSGALNLGGSGFFAHAMAGSVTLTSDCDQVAVQRVCAAGDVTIEGDKGVTIVGDVDAGGDISLQSAAGGVVAKDLVAGNGIDITSLLEVVLTGDIAATTGDVTVSTATGTIDLDANMTAIGGSIELRANQSLLQRTSSGITSITLLFGGQYVGNEPPTVTISIAGPENGGVGATAEASLVQTGTIIVDDEFVATWSIASITITSSGVGYAVGENPRVTIGGMPGAAAVATGPLVTRGIYANQNVTIDVGDQVGLVGTVSAVTGDLTVTALRGDVDLSASDVTVHAGGTINVDAKSGTVSARNLLADGDITIGSEGRMTLFEEVVSENGNITAASRSGTMFLRANVHADDGGIVLNAHGGVSQLAGSGLRRIVVLSGGAFSGTTPPEVTVTVAPPTSGLAADAAQAFAIVTQVGVDGDGNNLFAITEIEIVDPGRGYALNESPAVTIAGMPGAAAQAIGPDGYQDIVAENDVVITAGQAIELVNTVRSNVGDVEIRSTDGDLDLGDEEFFVHAVLGRVDLESVAGAVKVQKVVAESGIAVAALAGATIDGSATALNGAIDVSASAGMVTVEDLVAGSGITLQGLDRVVLLNDIITQTGNVSVVSTGDSIAMAANILASDGDVLLRSHQSLSQGRIALDKIVLVDGGTGYTNPIVTVSPPTSGGGVAATARAIVSGGRIAEVVIVTPGSGYSPGEFVTITIAQGDNVTAQAYGQAGMVGPKIYASGDVTVDAGGDVQIFNVVQSATGVVSVASENGTIDLSDPSLLLHAEAGSVAVNAAAGGVKLGSVDAKIGITAQSRLDLAISQTIRSKEGDISFVSDAGGVGISAVVSAEQGEIVVQAFGTVGNNSGGVSRVDVLTKGLGYDAETTRVVFAPPGGTIDNGQPSGGRLGSRAAAGRVKVDQLGRVVGIEIVDPGDGYLPGEAVLVEITGSGTGASAQAYADPPNCVLAATKNVIVEAGKGLSLVATLRSATGDVSVAAAGGDVDMSDDASLVQALDGSVQITAAAGSVKMPQISVAKNVTVNAKLGVSLVQEVDAVAGDIALTTTHGDFELGDGSLVAQAGGITLLSEAGAVVSPATMTAEEGIFVTSLGRLKASGEVLSTAGEIRLRSTAGDIEVNAVLTAEKNKITIDAFGQVQSISGGVSRVVVLNEGAGYDSNYTRVWILREGVETIDPDSREVVPLLGAAANQRENYRPAAATAVVDVELGAVIGINIVDPGVGYLPTDRLTVVIEEVGGAGQGSGASARALIDQAVQALSGFDDVAIRAGGGVELVGIVRSTEGTVSVESTSGKIEVISADAILQSLLGDVAVRASAGPVSVRQITAHGDVEVDAKLKLSLSEAINSTVGNIALSTTHGDLELSGSSVVAVAGSITLTSLAGEIKSPSAVAAGQGITATSFDSLTLNGISVASAGAIVLKSVGGDIQLNGNLAAEKSSISVDAIGAITSAGTGVSSITVLTEGSNYPANFTKAFVLFDWEELDETSFEITGDQVEEANLPANFRRANARPVVNDAGEVLSVEILDPGAGYRTTDSLTVFIRDIRGVNQRTGGGAEAFALVSDAEQAVSALGDIALKAGGGITLIGVVKSFEGNVDVESTSQAVDISAADASLQSFKGSVAVRSLGGEISLQEVSAYEDVDVTAKFDVSVTGGIDSAVGNITVATTHGNLDFSLTTGSIVAQAGNVSLSSAAGVVRTPKSISAAGDILATSLEELRVNGTIVSGAGDINLKSSGRDVVLNAVVSAEKGGISLDALANIKSFSGGITRVPVVGEGSRYSQSDTLVFILIAGEETVDTTNWTVTRNLAAPDRENFVRASVRPVVDSLTGKLVAVEIVDPGKGYREGDELVAEVYDTRTPTVGSGAAVTVYVDPPFQSLVAGQDLLVRAGDELELIGVVRSEAGDISIESKSGRLINLSSDESVVQAMAGSVAVIAHAGELLIQQISATGDVDINARLGVSLARAIDSSGGTIRITSEQGDVDLDNADNLQQTDEYAKRSRVLAEAGAVEINALTGKIFTPETLRAAGSISLKSASDAHLLGIILSDQGDITVESEAARLTLNAVVKATEGSVDIKASADLDDVGGGLTKIQLVNSGGSYSNFTRIVVAPPKGGGEAARVRPTIVDGRIVNLEIIYPGRGYQPGEIVVLNDDNASFIDFPESPNDEAGLGAEAVVFCETPTQSIAAGEFVRIETRDDLKLFGVVRADGVGGIEIRSTSGNVELSGFDTPTLVAHATQGPLIVQAPGGYARVNDLLGELDVVVAAEQDITVLGLVRSATKSITLESTSGAIGVEADGKVHAVLGSVELLAKRGEVSLLNIFAGEDISVESLGAVKLSEAVHAVNGDLTVVSTGGIDNAGRVETGGSVSLTASLGVTSLGGGIVKIDLLSGGYNYEYAIVTVAGPASGGGRAATARATITDGVITSITILDPGYGYAAGEVVNIDIEGQPERVVTPGADPLPAGDGARAVATANATSSSLFAGESIAIKAGTLAEVSNEMQAKAGSVTVQVTAGPLKVSEVYATEDVAFSAAETITIGGLLWTSGGDVDIESTGGSLAMQGRVLAPAGKINIETAGEVVQRGAGVSRDGIYLLSGGRGYTYALVIVNPPPGTGETALARAVITDPNPFDDEESGYISDIILLDPGWGYPSDSRVTVRIQGDGEGAEAVFETDIFASTIEGRDDVTITSGDSVTLVSTVRSAAGGVGILATLGDVAIESITAGKAVAVASNRGEVSLVSVSATEDVDVTADQGLSVTDSLNTVNGDIALQSLNDDITFAKRIAFDYNYLVDQAATEIDPSAVISSKLGAIAITAHNGSIVTPYVINAGGDVSLSSLRGLELTQQITSQAGDIRVESTSSLVRLRSNMVAEDGSITIEAQTTLQQEFVSGVSKIELLSPGPMQTVPPAVTVTVAAPRNGGEAATAYAIIERRERDDGDDDDGNPFNNIIEYEYFIGSIVIINPGYGYEVGENPVVTITGVDGATARAYGPTMVAMITAQDDVNLLAGENITLLTKIHAVGGDVTVASKTGDLDLTASSLFLSSKFGGIDIDAYGGSIDLQRAQGFDDVTLNAAEGINILRSVMSENGGIEVVSTNNAVNVRQLNAKQDVLVSGFKTSKLIGEIVSSAGDVTAESTAGGLWLNANVVAGDDVSLSAQTFLEQMDPTGIEALEIIAAGSDIQVTLSPVPPTVGVVIAPPAGGGRAATGEAVIDKRFLGNDPSGTPIWEYYIKMIEIIDPGSGYALGETPIVTISGMPGALVRAVGPTNLRNISAINDLSIEAGSGVKLINTVNSVDGDISIGTVNGNVDIAGAKVVIGSQNGGLILDSINGTILLPPVLQVEGSIALRVNGDLDVTNDLTSVSGSLTLVSRSGAIKIGSTDGGDLVADERITLVARNGVTQDGGLIKARELVVRNSTTRPVTLTNKDNDVENLSIMSTGAVSYTDANDFETGVNRTGVLGVEVVGESLSLTSMAPYSKVRVVSGLQYRTLSISAGANTPSMVGNVEYVTTSTGDNAPVLVGGTSPFAGTLRDMIRYANANAATYVVNGAARPQPQAMVFDEEGYDVTSVTVAGAALPGFTKPVEFDGGRLTDDVLTASPDARLGVVGGAGLASGLRFDPGSNGSRMNRLAVGGFSDGSGIMMTSGGMMVTDVWAGTTSLGVAAANRVGIEVAGTSAVGNQIGSAVVDPTTQNRITNSTVAGVLVRSGATGTRVYGNRITGNRDGVWVNAATGTLIGTPGSTWADLTTATSNVIANNTGHGIQIVNANAGSMVTSNRVLNNEISDNGLTGVTITGSQFALIGGTAAEAGNVVVRQGGAGLSISGSSNVRVVGNDIGIMDGAPMGNGSNGVLVSGSKLVDISGGNRIGANAGNGIAITNGSSGVTVLGNTVGQQGAGNKADGIAISNSIGNTVGSGNLVSHNLKNGVSISNAQAATLAAGNRVTGSSIFANLGNGIAIAGGSRSTIGGTKAAEANVIYGNCTDSQSPQQQLSGIRIVSSAATGSPTGHLIQGNFIGTNRNRDINAALGNKRTAGITIIAGTGNTVAGGNVVMNNTGYGVEVLGGTGNVVGGSATGLGNVIMSNGTILPNNQFIGGGIRVSAATTAQAPDTHVSSTMRAARSNRVEGNTIANNRGHGIDVAGTGVTGLTIGHTVTATTVTGVPNQIRGNRGHGVAINAGAQQVSLQGNSIAENGGDAIRHLGLANRSTTPVSLSLAELRGSGATQSVTITGSLNLPAFKQQQYTIDFYANAPEDGDYKSLTGYEARRHIGRATVVADATGKASFSVRITAPLAVGEVITAMASSLRFEAGSTSMLSNAVTADLPGLPTPRY